MALIETRQDRIVRLNSNGLGVTDSGVELPYTLVGELVEYEKHVYRGKENYVLKNIIEPSPRRVTPPCKYYERCGGCLLQHLNEDDYNEFKRTIPHSDAENVITRRVSTQSQSQEFLRFTHGITTVAMLPRDDVAGYRNDVKNDTMLLTPQNQLRRRLNLVFKNSENGLHFGFYKYRSDKIVNIDSCIAAENSLSSLLPEIRKILESIAKPSDSGEVFLLQAENGIDVKILLESKDIFNERNRGKLNSLVGKHGVIRLVYSHNKQIVFKNVIASDTKKHHCEEGEARRGNLMSLDFLTHEITTVAMFPRDDVKNNDCEPYVTFAGEKVAVEADCFLQPTKDSDKLLSDLVLKYIGADTTKRVADLFCGRGTYTIPILKSGFNVSGFESDKNALGALRLKHNNVYQRDLHYNPLSKELKDFEIIVINPPRAGTFEQVKKILEVDNIEKIVYISCSLESFNRDAKILEAKYKLDQIVAIDQFLWNPHVEIAAEFIKQK